MSAAVETKETKSFVCNVCRKEYSSRASLNKHYHSLRHIAKDKAKQAGRKTESYDRFCTVCSKTYFNAQSLKKHFQSKSHQVRVAAITTIHGGKPDIMSKLEQLEKSVLPKRPKPVAPMKAEAAKPEYVTSDCESSEDEDDFSDDDEKGISVEEDETE